MNNHPPKHFTKLLKWFCHDELYEELQGDLEESYYRNVEAKGAKEAKTIYRKEVLKMIRPSIIKPKRPARTLTTSLFKVHWALSIRSLKRNKVFSAVTILGFAAAVSISLFLINIIYSGFSLDRQHDDLDRIYRVATEAIEEGEVKKHASTPFELKAKIDQEIPGFDLLTHVNRTLLVSFQKNGTPINLNGIYVDENFLKVFNFPVLSGDATDIFNDRNSVIITQETAQKLFSDQNPIGQVTEQGHVVRAVISSPKNKSHIPFEVIGNIDALDNSLPKWEYRNRNYLYGLISSNTNVSTIEDRLTSLTNSITGEEKSTIGNYTFYLQSINGIMFKDGVFNEIGSSVGREGLITFSVLTILLIAMASFNYTNLSLARAFQRTKEIGVRKVAGSTSLQIISQFLIETLLFTSHGFIIGLGIYVYYSSRISEAIPFPFLEITDFQIIGLFLGFAIVIGFSAGIFPAIFFSRISALALFNQQSSRSKLSFKGLRKLFVGGQLTVSMFCIVLLSLIIDQHRSLRKTPSGIETKQLLVVSTAEPVVDIMIQEFNKISGVSDMTVVSNLPLVDFPRNLSVIKKDMPDSVNIRFLQVDENFQKVFNPQLRQGEFFNKRTGEQDYYDVVVSQGLLQKMNIADSDALGTLFNDETTSYQIVGVLNEAISANPLINQDEAMMLVNSGSHMNSGRLIVKVEGKDLSATLDQIEAAWSSIFVDRNFQANFLETQIDSTFEQINTAIRIISFLGGCIVLISILGQLGMALFNAQSRVKEISIRKVLGAALSRIFSLILKGTIKTITIAAIIATPLAYMVFKIMVATEVRTPLNISPWLLFKGVLVLALLVIGVVISQTWKVVSQNPTKSLRSE